jgi:hypothetical protein
MTDYKVINQTVGSSSIFQSCSLNIWEAGCVIQTRISQESGRFRPNRCIPQPGLQMADRIQIMFTRTAAIAALLALLALTLTAQDVGIVSETGFLLSAGGRSTHESVTLDGSLGSAFDLNPISNGEIRLVPGGLSVIGASIATGDFDGDGMVGFSDFLIFAGAFGSQPGDPTFRSDADLDQSGDVGFGDFLIFAAAFGQ